MRIFLITLVGLALLCGGAYASVPDPDLCTVLPGDNMPAPRMLGIPATTGVTAANLDITVRASDGTNISNALVEVVLLPACAIGSTSPLCVCSNIVLSGYTSTLGFVRLNMKFGGCCTQPSSCIILADGTPIRGYDKVVSPDYNGLEGNCAVQLSDFVYFANGYGQSGAVCRNFSGDATETCGLPDFVTFAAAYGKSCSGS
jgi:hypothetical protein